MQTDEADTATRFCELDVPEQILRALDELNFEYCTEIQALSLPVIIAGKDVAAQAQTGTGKTAAFLVGLMRQLILSKKAEKNKHPRALILAPTRELAIQIFDDAKKLGKYCDLKLAVAYGGTDYEKQRNTINEGTDILIGTPGRLIDYFKQGVFNLKQIECLVLDEADRMFDLGFIADIRYLMRRMPPPEERIGMLFSATLSHRVMELAYEHMNTPTNVKTQEENITAEGVRQTLYHPAGDEKIPLLIGLLQLMQPKRTIVFVNTRRAAEKVEAFLAGNDFECGLLSGGVRQTKRQRLLKQFSEGQLPILIATDVAARGLHIDDVTHVFNYDLPQNAEDYVHRIGRTARAGNTGEAISFACEEYAFSLMDIEEYIEAAIPTANITDDLIITPKPAKKRPPSAKQDAAKRGQSRRRRPQKKPH